MSGRHILHLRFDVSVGHDAELPERLRRLLLNVTPRVQMIEPDSAALDITGAIPYWKRDARGLYLGCRAGDRHVMHVSLSAPCLTDIYGLFRHVRHVRNVGADPRRCPSASSLNRSRPQRVHTGT
jgi:hypothetical protein